MEKENARRQTLEQLHERRKQVVRLHKKGIKVMQIVALTGLSYPPVRAAIDLFEAGGWSAIRPALRGRRRGDGRVLSQVQEDTIQRMIIDKRPEQLKMDFHLWSRAAVGQLIEQEFGIKLQARSVGKYLTRWGFTPQKPIKRAYEQSPAAVQAWLEGEYPGIEQRARAQGVEIHWGDETALVNTDVRGRSYAPTDALERFEPNREVLDKDVKAAVALSNLEGIRDNPNPWSTVSQIEPFITTVDTVNEALAQRKREHALLSIDAKIAEVDKALDAAQASASLRNSALLKLQELKAKVAGLTSIPMIFYCQEQAGDALDAAMVMIESATPKAAPTTAAEKGSSTTATKTSGPVVAPKPTKAVRAADYSLKTYLETEADVDAYLAKLKAELLAVIQSGGRARLQ